MSDDFYCDEVLSGRTPVERMLESENVLAFYHTRPSYPVHIVVIPKKHIPSLIDLTPQNDFLILEMIQTIKTIASDILQKHGACRVVTNLGDYQESKHLHWHIISGQAF